MAKIKRINIFFFLLISPFILPALELPKIDLDLDIPFQHYSFEEGLRMMATRIEQDRLGYLWFGTAAGLYRYDGYEFKHLYPRIGFTSDSLSRIQGICEDASGNIWFGQYGYGIVRLDRNSGEITRFRHDAKDTTSLSADNIGGFFLDSYGFLWVACFKSLENNSIFLDRLDTKTGLVKRYRHNDRDTHSLTANGVPPAGIGAWNPLVMDENSNRDLWIGLDENGVVRYNREKDNFSRFYHDPHDPASLSSNSVTNLALGKDGAVYIFTQKGLNQFNPANQSFIRFRHDPRNPHSLGDDSCTGGFIERSNRLWIAHQKGLDRYNPVTKSFDHFNYDPNNLKTPSRADRYLPVYEDAYGAIWFLTHGDVSTVNIFDPNTQSFQRYENSPHNSAGYHMSQISSCAADSSHCLWMGSYDGVVNKVYTNTNRFYIFSKSESGHNSLPCNHVKDLLESKKRPGMIWIATSAGLSRLDWQQGTIKNYRHDPGNSASLFYDDIRCLDEDNHGNIWFATKNGIGKLDALGSFTHFHHNPDDSSSLSDDNINTLCCDPKGYVWICPESGVLNRLDIKSGKVKRFHKKINDPHYISAVSQTFTVYIDHSGIPWICTDQGLNTFDYGTEYFTLHKIFVPKLTFEDRWGNFWGGAFRDGLFKFDRKTDQCIYFPQNHPLANCQIRDIVEEEDGLLWIGTDHGLVRLDPRDNSFLSLSKQHGLPETQFLTCGLQLKNGWMLWGTSSRGLILFDPKGIRQNLDQAQVAIAEIRVSNKPLVTNDKNPLNCELSYPAELNLAYDQNDISFICAALNYVRPEENQYSFWLENYDKGWYEAGTNRIATYTNLDPGTYIFHVKASNSEGAWSENSESMHIRIRPPWFATAWAYAGYVLILAATGYYIWTNQMRRIQLRNELKFKKMEAEKLKEIDSIKTRFLANISHEFRTPLTLILGPVEQLLKKIKKSELTTEIKIMQRNAERLARLVNQLLDLSKIEAGRMSLKTRSDDLIPFVNRIVQSFESRARLKHIDISFDSKHASLNVYFDHEKMENVLYNLIANAIKFTPERGNISVTVEKKKTATQPSDPLGTVAIAVQDSGPGIPENQLERIFDRFYQIENQGNYQEASTGIGLALAKELVELHHGRLTVVSRPGQGSLFTVILPLGRNRFTDEEITESASLPHTLPKTAQPQSLRHALPGSSGKGAPAILVVEDNADLRYYIRTILQDQFRMFEAEGGMQGFECAVKEMPDLIITDVMMPGLNGFELCEKFKIDERTSHIPVIMLTARADTGSKIHGLQTGADDYVVKPFNETELKVRINNLIRQRQNLRERFSRDILTPMKDVAVTSADERFLQRAFDHITQHIDDSEFNLSLLCKHMGLSRSQLHRKLKATVNLSTTEFIRSIRLRRAAELLKKRFGNIAEVAYAVGFSNPAYFSECFHKQFGVLPSEFKAA